LKFQKGDGRPRRPKGSENKAKKTFREAINHLLENSQDQFIEWLAQIEDPKDRFNVIKDLAEYAYPKYARLEVANVDTKPTELVVTFQSEEKES
jgi:hypothetical protein